MTKYLLKRVAILLATLWVVVTLSFFLMQVMPGTPYNNPKLTDEMIAMMNKQYGLDKPLWQQYLKYLFDILHGDFGTSYQSINQSVTRLISQRLGVSVHLGIQALVVGPMAANILTGSALIEQIFSIPGIGQQFVSSIPTKDYPVIMGTTIVYALMLMVAILITDIIISIADPRVRLG